MSCPACRPNAPVEIIETEVILGLALPDHEHGPPRTLEFEKIALISHDVTRELVQPELLPLCWRRRISAKRMPMPEASVHENHDMSGRENQVRTTRKTTVMKPKAQSCGMEVAADPKLRARVLAANARHHSGSCLAVDDVGHCNSVPCSTVPVGCRPFDRLVDHCRLSPDYKNARTCH